jgi:hypothetical protein
MDSDVRRDVPAAKHYNSFFTFPLGPSPCDYKREMRATITGLDLQKTKRHFKGLGLDTLSRPTCNPYYKHS